MNKNEIVQFITTGTLCFLLLIHVTDIVMQNRP